MCKNLLREPAFLLAMLSALLWWITWSYQYTGGKGVTAWIVELLPSIGLPMKMAIELGYWVGIAAMSVIIIYLVSNPIYRLVFRVKNHYTGKKDKPAHIKAKKGKRDNAK